MEELQGLVRRMHSTGAPELSVRERVGLGFACGGVSGMVVRTILHPIDTIRVLKTVSTTDTSVSLLSKSVAEVPLMQRLRAVAAPIRSLYSGFGFAVFGSLPVYAVYFGAYEAFCARLPELFPGHSSSLMQISSGFLAECCTVVIWSPWEVVRQRMQLASSNGFQQTFRDVLSESGVRGLYGGIGAYMALWGTWSPLMFVIYEQGIECAYWKQRRELAANGRANALITPSLGMSFLIGSFAGSVASVITSPLDVIKTRMQTQTPTSLTRYTSVLHGLREVTRHEGLWALYRGTAARALNSGLSSGLLMGMYGVMRASLTKRLGIGPAERSKGPMAADARPELPRRPRRLGGFGRIRRRRS